MFFIMAYKKTSPYLVKEKVLRRYFIDRDWSDNIQNSDIIKDKLGFSNQDGFQKDFR